MNGNLTSLSRYGLNASGTARAGLIDLTLTNTGNRLTSIGTSAVGYDYKGRQTSYSHGGASTMSNNAIDLPLLYTKGTTSVESGSTVPEASSSRRGKHPSDGPALTKHFSEHLHGSTPTDTGPWLVPSDFLSSILEITYNVQIQ